MAKSVDQTLDRILALRRSGASAEAEPELRKFLSSKTNLIVAKAADAVAALHLKALAPDLETAFVRLLNEPPAADKGCLAKNAIAKALVAMECASEAVLVPGSKHVEPTWGGSSDSAAELRSICALALPALSRRVALFALVDRLVDPEPAVRVAAAQAVAHVGGDEGELLLRLKALSEDERIEVTEECLAGLMRVAPARSAAIVREFLESPRDDERDAALSALSASRSKEAFDLLRESWKQNINSAWRERLLSAMALSRFADAIEFLINVIASGNVAMAEKAIEAMAMYRHDEAVRTRIRAAVDERSDEKLARKFTSTFSG
jgi:hypothetical protein